MIAVWLMQLVKVVTGPAKFKGERKQTQPSNGVNDKKFVAVLDALSFPQIFRLFPKETFVLVGSLLSV